MNRRINFNQATAYNTCMQGIKVIINDSFKKVRKTFSYLSSKKYTTLAGTMAFFLVMSVVPFLFWLTIIFGRLNIDYTYLFDLEIFKEVKDVLIFFRESAQSVTAGASIILLITTLYSSTTLFYHMRRSGEIIYESRRRKGSIVLRLSALVLIFIVMLVLVLGVAMLMLGSVFLRRILPSLIAQVAVYALVGLVAFALILLLNLYICPYRIGVRNAIWGSLLTLLLGGLASFGFTLYANFSSLEKLYGAAVFFILFLLWLYLLMICFVIGVILNCYLFEKDGMSKIIHKKF